MVYEIADIEVAPESAADFESAVADAAQHFRKADGCQSFRLERSVDQPGKYRLVVGWDSVEAHMVDFRASDGFEKWRALAGPFFLRPPVVDHVEVALRSF